MDGLLADCGIARGDVDRVFLTGGSSLVPAVRALFAARFGEERIRSGDELTSVASGLALRAHELPLGRRLHRLEPDRHRAVRVAHHADRAGRPSGYFSRMSAWIRSRTTGSCTGTAFMW